MVKQKFDSRIKLTIPGIGYIEIAGTSGFVSTMFNNIKIDFYNRLQEALKNFKGNYEVIEKTGKNKTEIEIVESQK